MATDKIFDTNILLYLISANGAKADRAERLLAEGGVISVQVLNEFAVVARRKHALEWPDLERLLEDFRSRFKVESLTPPLQLRAMALARRYPIGIYDANIIAAAEQAGCDVIYSEDMQHGQVMEGLTLVNPFVDL